MADKGPVGASAVTTVDARETGASDGVLETSRLLVELLHAAYATRHLDAADTAGADAPAASSHAIRAAIHIHQHGERTVGQLASGLGISYGWASRVVEELEAYRYVIRERDPEDRRVVRVRLDPDALELVERAYRWRGHAVEDALEPLSESERDAIRVFLRRLTESLRESAPEQPGGAG